MTISSRLPRDPSVFRRLLNVRGEEDWSIAFRRLAALLGKVATATVQSRAPRRILRPRSVASTKLGPIDGRGPVEPLDALDRGDLGKPGPARPSIDGGSLIAGVDGELGDAKPRAMGMRPGPPEQARQFAPARLALRTASDHNVVGEPAGQAAAPGPDRDLDPVLLDVRAGGQEQAAARHRADAPGFAPLVEPLPIGRFPALDPGLAEDPILEAVPRLIGCLRGLPHPGDAGPGQPAGWRIEGGQMKPDGAGIRRRGGRLPAACGHHRGLVAFLDRSPPGFP